MDGYSKAKLLIERNRLLRHQYLLILYNSRSAWASTWSALAGTHLLFITQSQLAQGLSLKRWKRGKTFLKSFKRKIISLAIGTYLKVEKFFKYWRRKNHDKEVFCWISKLSHRCSSLWCFLSLAWLEVKDTSDINACSIFSLWLKLDLMPRLVFILISSGLMPLLPALRPIEEDVKWESVLPHSCIDPTRWFENRNYTNSSVHVLPENER